MTSPIIVLDKSQVEHKIKRDGIVGHLTPLELFVYDWCPDNVQSAALFIKQLQKLVLYIRKECRQR